MNLDRTQQAELERDEQWLASLITPTPSDAAMDRVRSAVRVAIDEQWMQPMPTPMPTPDILARVKAAVHETLRAGRRDVGYRVLGALSAAAAVLFAVGLARFAPYGSTAPRELRLGETFAAAWDAVRDDAGMSSLTADMAWLDEEINAWGNRSGRRTDELELENLQDRIDGLFTTPDYFSGTS